MDKEKLFDDFPPVDTESWKKKIKADLKGADYDKKLVWHTDEGFDVQPFYRAEDLKHLEHMRGLPGAYPFVRGNQSKGNEWKINQLIEVSKVKTANIEAQKAIENGVDSLAFDVLQPIDLLTLQQLLKGIDGERVDLNFRLPNTDDLPELLIKLAKNQGWDLKKIHGSVFCDPLAVENMQKTTYAQMTKLFETCLPLENFHSITVDAGIFHNSGGSTVSEMAFGLAKGSGYIQHLTEAGYEAEQIAGKMRFSFATGSNYFMEIAKFRALRFLWAKILSAYGVNKSQCTMMLHAVNSQWNKSLYDPYVNILRNTTEAMSAILGGADVITTIPFDQATGDSSELGKRIARNQQLILKKESFFDKVTDPAAGSYYIEMLTDKLIHHSWDLFLETDEKGGYEQVYNQGFVQHIIQKESQKKNRDIAYRKRSILGVNQFPNTAEKMEKQISPKVFFAPDSAEKLQPYRAATPFEALRYQTDRFALKHKRPQVNLFSYGNPSKSRARAQFATNFFGCAGYEIIDHSGFTNLDAGIKIAENNRAEIVVLCGADEEYADWVFPVFEALRHKSVVVLAGYPVNLVDKLKNAGMEYFIHNRCNVLEELKKYQKLIGINR